jgi:uncharacterized membrane protein
MSNTKMTDRDIERMVSALLRGGVILAALVVLAGGSDFLWRHGNDPVQYRTFVSQPGIDCHLVEIVVGAFSGRARSIIQLGILLLIATPIARVALSLVGFAIEGDRKYVLITSIVLAVLLYSLIAGAAGKF